MSAQLSNEIKLQTAAPIEGWHRCLLCSFCIAASLILGLPGLVPFATASVHAASATIEPEDLRVAGLDNPVGVDELHVIFSWKLHAVDKTRNDLAQTSYRLIVSSSAERLAADEADVWDSGRLPSSSFYSIAFGGSPLQSHTTYFWKVKTWDQSDRPSGWSQTGQWTTALLRPTDWSAHWISSTLDMQAEPQMREQNGVMTDLSVPLPIFRREFTADKPVKRATVFISGLGQYELDVNGKNVTSSVLNPGWSNYRKTQIYNSYDVTRELHSGSNSLGVLLGNGMYNVLGVRNRYTKFIGTFGPPKFILQLQLTYADGTEATIVSDRRWRTTSGPITFSSTYGGEDYDARKYPTGWEVSGFDDDQWQPALEVDSPTGELSTPGMTLVAQTVPPMGIAKFYPTVRVTRPARDVRVYDLGQNMSGWPVIHVQGHVGDIIRLLPGELLDAKGMVTQASANDGVNDPVLFSYTLGDTGRAAWQPRFSYYGFRYVQVELIPATRGGAAPTILSLEGGFIHDRVTTDGRFTTSVPQLDRIHSLIDMAVLSNLSSIITDCPTREKLGWLEQTYLNAGTLMFNYGVKGLYEKTLDDIGEAQLDDGLIPSIAPEYVAFVDEQGRSTAFRDSPEWGSAVILSAWAAYQFYGSTQPLEEHYDAMRRYLRFLQGRTTDHMLSYGLGDWYDIGPESPGESQLTGKALTATATYYQDLQSMRSIATLLGKVEDAESFATEAALVKEAFNRKLFHAETSEYDRGSQTANAMPLVVGLVPEDRRAAVLAHLVQNIHDHKEHVTAGDIGFHYVVRALTDGGRSDVLYAMLARTDSPSYGYQLSRGATTLTEAWDTNPHSSQNHFMLGHAEEWFYRGLAGIDFDMSRSDPRRIVIHPAFVSHVPDASAHFDSVLGRIESSWKKTAAGALIEVSIPVGSQATIELPRGATLDGRTREGAPPGREKNGVLEKFIVGSGRYRFHIGINDMPARNRS